MKMRLIRSAIVLCVCLMLTQPLYAATAKETVETQVSKILEKLKDPAFKQLTKDQQIEDIRVIINSVFDYDELSKRTLGREWKKFNPGQRKEFVTLFSELLEKTYADRLLAYTSEKIEFGNEMELKTGYVEVGSDIITTDNKKIPLNYRLYEKDGQWRVYDVIIEGISLVKNYRSQFRDILSKDSPDKLLETMRDKVHGG
jgi:phospholipid transport system substrate-binding protein